MFDNKKLDVWNISDGSTDDDGIYQKGTWGYVKTIRADVQPYSSELAKRDYGLEIEVKNRVFCKLDSAIKEGTIMVFKGKAYEVNKIPDWDDYLDILINDIDMPTELVNYYAG